MYTDNYSVQSERSRMLDATTWHTQLRHIQHKYIGSRLEVQYAGMLAENIQRLTMDQQNVMLFNVNIMSKKSKHSPQHGSPTTSRLKTSSFL